MIVCRQMSLFIAYLSLSLSLSLFYLQSSRNLYNLALEHRRMARVVFISDDCIGLYQIGLYLKKKKLLAKRFHTRHRHYGDDA